MQQLYTESLNIFAGHPDILFTHETNDRFVRTDQPFPHTHACYELYLLIRGTGDLVIEGHSHRLSAGTVAVFRNGEAHTMERLHSEHCEHLYIYFSAESFPPFATDSPLAMFTDRAVGEANTVTLPEKQWESLLTHVRQIEELPAGNRIAKYAALLEILSLISTQWHETYTPQSAAKELHHPLLSRAMRYIDLNFMTLDGVAEIADALGISHAYLTRLFRTYLHMPPSHVLRAKRIAFAKVLLIDGLDVAQTCERVGFRNYSNFIQAFRREIGMTPLAFQRANGIVRR